MTTRACITNFGTLFFTKPLAFHTQARGAKNWERPIELDFRGFECDHEVLEELEGKNLVKVAKFGQNTQILKVFCF